MKRKYRRLRYEDRKVIEKMSGQGKSVLEIAQELGTHRDTIYKEFTRSGLDKDSYKAELAQKRV